jgi:hypothetical protein
MLHRTIKEAHLIDVAIPNGHKLYSTITEKLHKCKPKRRANKNILNMVYSAPLVFHNRLKKR